MAGKVVDVASAAKGERHGCADASNERSVGERRDDATVIDDKGGATHVAPNRVTPKVAEFPQ